MDMHKTLNGDDKFLACVGRAQKAVEDLTKLSKNFGTPVSSQIMALDHLAEDFAKLSKEFHALRSK